MKKAWNHFFTLSVYYYLRNRESLKGNKHLRHANARTLSFDAYEFRQTIKSMNRFDFKIDKTIIIFIYDAWHHRTLYQEANVVTLKKQKSQRKLDARDVHDVHDENDDDKSFDIEEMNEFEAQKYSFKCENLFAWVILNETHKLRFFKIKINLLIN